MITISKIVWQRIQEANKQKELPRSIREKMDLGTILSNPMDLQFILTSSPDRSPNSISNHPTQKSQVSESLQSSNTTQDQPDNPSNESKSTDTNTVLREEQCNPPTTPSLWTNWDLSNTQQAVQTMNAIVDYRRQRNRENMRRMRQQQKNNIVRMREEVAQLECLHLALLSNYMTVTAGTQGRLTQMAETLKQLSAENVSYRARIQQQSAWKQRFSIILEFEQRARAEEELMIQKRRGCLDSNEAAIVFRFYHPITNDQATKTIVKHAHTINRIQQHLLTHEKPIHIFGWDMRRRVDGGEMMFLFIKRFTSTISIYELMDADWKCDMLSTRVLRIGTGARKWEVLQWVNDDAVALGSDIRALDNRTIFRTVSLRFRTTTTTEVYTDSGNTKLVAKGYRVGNQSINPDWNNALLLADSQSDHEQLHWADLTLSMEFLEIVDPITNQEQIEIWWSGKTNYKNECDAYRDATDVVSNLLRWELAVMGPALNVIPPCT